jgi:Tol biopolymer transport system component
LWIAYASGNAEYMYGEDWFGVSSIWTVPSAGGDVMNVASDGYLNVSPAWSPAERRLFYVSNRGGGRDIYAIGINSRGTVTGDPERITVGSDIHSINIATDAELLAYSQLRVEANLRSFQLPARTPADVTELEHVTLGAQVIETFTQSPNGAWIAFSSDRSGNQDIYRMQLEGGDLIRLTTDPSDDFVGRGGWSPDGTELAFQSMRTGNRDVFVMSADGGPAEQVTDDPAEDRMPTWSQGGTGLAWVRDGVGLYVISRTGSTGAWSEEQLLRAFSGGGRVTWSPRGRYIAYQGSDSLMVVDSESGERLLVRELPGLPGGVGGCVLSWASDGNALYYVESATGSGATLWIMQVPDGSTSRIANIVPLADARVLGAEVRDSRVLLSVETSESNVWIAELLERD